MGRKIYVSPSDQVENRYAAGNTNEAVQCRAIGRLLVAALQRCGFEPRTNETDGAGAIYERIRESNVWGAELHLPIHTNAFNGSLQGTRLFCYDLQGRGYQAGKAILDRLKPLVPGESDNIQTARYTEITGAVAPCAYCEVAFHDNQEQAQWIIDHKGDIAEAICQGVCDYFGTAYRAPGKYYLRLGPFDSERDAAVVKNMLQSGEILQQ